ncbi:MAG: CDP-glucose 4,6-dehydratase [Elusimicrobia bacterium RIFOXYB2_FULL_49_7]|nr:MAG: CDP-glucose 4,6-dehydratase [Elusimicrobia bacterium RIFOXYB2_FULL_49_7]
MQNTMKLNLYKNKLVLLTGDTGFKGSWLSMALLHLGANVNGYALPALKKSHFHACGLSQKIHHTDADIRDLGRLKKAMLKAKPTFVFHLAAQPLVLESYQKPRDTFDVNVMGTLNVLEAIRATPSVKACVIITTDKVYENPENQYPFPENSPLGGHDPYSASKAGAEIVTQSYFRSFFQEKNKAAIATARAGNVMGGGDWAMNRIVPDCIRSLQTKKPILLRHPESVRPWQHVLEPLHGYLLLGAALADEGKEYSGAWNFGPLASQAKTVEELAKTIIAEWGCGDIQTAARRTAPHEARYLRLNSNKAHERLKWKPVLGFKKTVQQTVLEYREMDQLSSADLFRSRIDTIRHYFTACKL